ncbi:hypothetical protein M5E06_33100 [Azospirillum sp. A1-3]|uniref:hypothetical protein n=1 Tax=Azospirillum sp. A1-3 TaxID=185874 RepID=UPI0020771692|nr:hypothetical protein [Azospirillum sp. A1-3]MCM8738923.1 hypothetical protein [Azospirillum sp. A1-3]
MKNLVLALTVVTTLSGAAFAETVTGVKGKLAHLALYIGSGEYEAVLADPMVKQNLLQVVGKANMPQIERDLDVRGEIEYREGCLVLEGNAPHQGGEEGVSIWIKVYDGSVRVGQIHKRKSIIYAKDSQYNYIPSGLRDYVKNPTFNMESKPPSGVTWMR